MFNLARNESKVFFKQYLGKKESVNADGYNTGSFVPHYGDLKSAYLTVSSNRGSSETEMFGSLEAYDRTMITADIRCPINEESILWLDGADTQYAHNYVVTKRAPWKNSIVYAIRKVTVSVKDH
ncbi:MAG: hypothetical protein KH354_03960 [Clostridiales bacterium]|nr:hypothetical protein [Clostridiales bacterium]